MTGEFIDLSKLVFTNDPNIINPGKPIFNPRASNVKTLEGDDNIIGNDEINRDFVLGVFVEIPDQDSDPSVSVDLSSQAVLRVNGIRNQGNILTNGGSDVVAGTATAKIAAIAETVSVAIAYADTLDTSAIANIVNVVDIKAIANGINNSGRIATGDDSDTVDGDLDGSIAAVATATVDVTAIVEEISQAPVSDGLTAFADVIAVSIAQAEIIARGINNQQGLIITGEGGDAISANATSSSATLSEASASTVASAPEENQALAGAIVDALAEVADEAIAIDNNDGLIFMGKLDEDDEDTIEATAEASGKAIAIKNIGGEIRTGGGNDLITGYATGSESYGIFGGDILTGAGADRVEASSFGGSVNIYMGHGADFVQGFGESTVSGGAGFDTISFGSYNKSDFSIYTDNSFTIFQLGDTIMQTHGFENYIFADGNYSDDMLMS